MAVIDRDSAYWPHVFAAVVLAVAGNSVTFVAANVVALAHARPDEQSLVGGLFNTAMQVGGGRGLAVMTVVAAGHLGGPGGDALPSGYRAAFRVAAVVAALGLLVAVSLIRRVPDSAAVPDR